MRWAGLFLLVFCARAGAGDAVIPFTIEQISGSRPVLTLSVNNRQYPAMLHSNAGLFLQINHAQAAAVGVTGLTHRDAYGIEAPGRVSALGRDTGVAALLAVGAVRDRNVTVSVFEKPVDTTILGLGWITAHGAIVDYPHHRIVVPDGASTPAVWRTRLLATGYTAHAMRRDPVDGRYLVTATINGQSTEMVVSTVVDVTIDTGFAARAGLAQGRVIEDYGGPSGATGHVYESAAPAAIWLGGWQATARPLPIEDTYAYMRQERPANPRGGMLGADFLIAYHAVIDFGTLTLYVR
jgi:hypothetical protein